MVGRVLPIGRAGIPFLVAADLQMRQTKAVAKHSGLHKRNARARVEAHPGPMLAFDLDQGVKGWRRACVAQGWCWTREQQVDPLGRLPGPFEPTERGLGPAIAVVWGVCESSCRDACVTEWTLAQPALERAARLQVISLGRQRQDRR